MKNINDLNSNQILHRFAIIVGTAILLAGCANTPPPVEQMAVSRAAITNANSTGANEFAPIPFKSAVEKMGAAERAMLEKNYELALQLAEQAQVDAQFAAAATRTVKAQKASDAVQEDSRVLRKEIGRKP